MWWCQKKWPRVVRPVCAGAVLVLCALNSAALPLPQENRATQEQASKQTPLAQGNTEITSSESQSIIRVRVPVVVVRVVVKDASGNVVSNLKREDFQIQDNNKPQEITTFAIEHPASRTVQNLDENTSTAKEYTNGATRPEAIAVSSRYVVLLLDDVHIETNEAVSVRTQAMEAIQSLQPKRPSGGIFDFGANPSRLHEG